MNKLTVVEAMRVMAIVEELIDDARRFFEVNPIVYAEPEKSEDWVRHVKFTRWAFSPCTRSLHSSVPGRSATKCLVYSRSTLTPATFSTRKSTRWKKTRFLTTRIQTPRSKRCLPSLELSFYRAALVSRAHCAACVRAVPCDVIAGARGPR